MRDYDKPLTIVLTGTGNSTKANTEALLENFIFGNVDGDVAAHMIVPFADKPKTGLETAIRIMKGSFGIDGKDFTPIVEPEGGSSLITSAQATHQVPQGLAMSTALDMLAQAKEDGHDTAVICLYDPESASDFDVIDTAKTKGFTTLNLSEGLIDAFEGYESQEDKAKRKALEEAYAESVETTMPPKKATARPTTPRKRAAKKTVAPVSIPEPVELEKPLTEPLSGTQKLIAMAVEREAEKKAAWDEKSYQPDLEDQKKRDEIIEGIVNTELSGTIVMGSKLPADLEPIKDIQSDLAKAASSVSDSVTVAKSDIVHLGDAMEKMASGFADAIAIYKKIVENV